MGSVFTQISKPCSMLYWHVAHPGSPHEDSSLMSQAIGQ